MELKNPFAIDESGRYITIYDLDEKSRGLQCKCKCLVCEGPFEARMGEVRQWHFAHTGAPCDKTLQYVNSAYLFVRQVIMEEGEFTYQGYKGQFAGGNIKVRDVEIAYRRNKMAEGLIIASDTVKLAVRLDLEIKYCVDVIKDPLQSLSTVLLDFSNIAGLPSNQLKELICREPTNRTWISVNEKKKAIRQNEYVELTADEPIHKSKEQKAYIQPKVRCAICKAIVHKEDARPRFSNPNEWCCIDCMQTKQQEGVSWKDI